MRFCLGLSGSCCGDPSGFHIFHFEGAVLVADDFEWHNNLCKEYMSGNVLELSKSADRLINYLGHIDRKKQMTQTQKELMAKTYPDVAPPEEPEQPPIDLTVMPEPTMTDDEIFQMMKASPEFEFFPKPATWFKKYGLEPIKARNFKEYLEDDAYFNARAQVVTEKVIIKGPQPGGVRPVPAPEVIPVEITSRPVEPSESWGVEATAQIGV